MTGLVIDNFAGGGGASCGISAALGRHADVALNHDAEACAMYRANHPGTLVLCQSVYKADPRDVVLEASRRRGSEIELPVDLAWFSPDCKHFSKAKGGKPVEKRIRDLAWVVVHWARLVKPRVIMLENVEEFRDWGPLIAAEGGKLVPCPARKGLTFRRWVRELRKLGYAVEWRELRACDYGAPTIRKRLFLVARRDGRPIVWPAPTHAKGGAGGLKPWRTAAECIDWSLPCPSIFLTREEGRALGCNRPLAPATMARIARGVKRYVLDAAEPFIVPITHTGDLRSHGIGEPVRTVTTAHRGEQALVTPFLVPRYGEREDQAPRIRSIEAPMPTVVPTENHGHLAAVFLAQHNGGMVGHEAREPVSTLTAKGSHQQLVAATLSHAYSSNTCGGQGDPRQPLQTVTAEGGHAGLVAAFLQKYYGTGGQDAAASEPMHTATAKARLGLVTVDIQGEPWVIADIGMRMLKRRELFRAQGFPSSYIVDRGLFLDEVSGKLEWRSLTNTASIRMVGNSVCPPLAEALVRANVAGAAAAPRAVMEGGA